MAIATERQSDRSAAEAALRTDFRSDTITHPTEEMRAAMAAAPLGDDVFQEDPTVNALEEKAARIFEKEAGIFLSSGTQGNLLACLSQTRPGEEVVAEVSAHVANSEVGGAARLGGLTLRPIVGTHGKITPAQIASVVRPPNVHYARTTLLAIENTHNSAGGTVWTVEEVEAAASTARSLGLKVHVDGARIFNAAVALGRPAADLAEPFDTVMVCLSKGLAAPVGSLLAGPAALLERAWIVRKTYGGGMRQAGVLAAAGLVALDEMVDRLAEDHANARALVEGLASLPTVAIDPESVQTNIVIFDLDELAPTAAELSARLKARGVLANPVAPRQLRMVTHNDVSRDDCLTAVEATREALLEN